MVSGAAAASLMAKQAGAQHARADAEAFALA
jgi:hypothetical protein